MPAHFLVAWISILLAGTFAHVVMFGLPALPLAVMHGAVSWGFAVSGGLLLCLTVLTWGGAVGGELLKLERQLPGSAAPGLHLRSPLMARLAPRLPGSAAVWLVGLALTGFGVRLRAEVARERILYRAVVFTAILPLIPLLLLLLDLPLWT